VRVALILALALVYIVLASQFNSFLQPLIVMTAQPLAVVAGCSRCGSPAPRST